MSIDIERLKVDADYWDEVAPGAAEYYAVRTAGFVAAAHDQCGEYIPRPTKQSQEWENGLPPVGCECEYRAKGGSLNNGPRIDWTGCKVLAVTHFYAILSLSGPGYASNHECSVSLSRAEFRPLRTKEQRLREEVVDLVAEASGIRARDGRGVISIDITDAILAKYELKERK